MDVFSNTIEASDSYTGALQLLRNVDTPPGELKQARQRFLEYIYEQIDNILNRCISQNNSRSSTPSLTSKSSASSVSLFNQKLLESVPTHSMDSVPAQSADHNEPVSEVDMKGDRVSTVDIRGEKRTGVTEVETRHDFVEEMVKRTEGQNSLLTTKGTFRIADDEKATGNGLYSSETKSIAPKRSGRVELFTCDGPQTLSVAAFKPPNFSNSGRASHAFISNCEQTSVGCNGHAVDTLHVGRKKPGLKKKCQEINDDVASFTPLAASSPANTKQRNITLADFVTPSRRSKRCSRRGHSNAIASQSQQSSVSELEMQEPSRQSMNSSSCGSWALGLSENDLTPLEGNSMYETKQGGSHCTKLHSPKVNNPLVNNTSATSNETKRCEVKPSRRITPTVVSTNSHRHDFKQQAVFMPQSPKKSQTRCAPGSYSEERQRLKEKKAQLVVPITKPESSTCQAKPIHTKNEGEKCVEPVPQLVSHREEIDEASAVLSRLIADGMTEDLTADLHFMLQLLCCQTADVCPCQQDCRSSHLLISAHNAVYFSLSVLSQCKVLQKMMDQSMKRLLGENERVLKFNSELAQLLSSDTDSCCVPNNPSFFSSVTFQSDTDDAKNFASDQNFIVFKKQRDLFYEIKREWDGNNTVSGWNFRQSCWEKIYQLLNKSGVGVSNYVHLSRLFVNQLMLSCLKGLDEGWTEAEEESIGLLSKLRLSQPDKYMKLRQRLIKPSIHSTQFIKHVDFYGQESFFKLFIDVAKDAIFTEHLKDALTLKLVSINKTEFDDFNEQDLDSAAAADTLSDCVLTARLLAKFLGYLHFLPYTGNEKRTALLDEQYGSLRSVMSPPLDISALLERAMAEGRSSVTIPWLVQYLSQMDAYCIALPYYHCVLSTLHRHFTALKLQLSASNLTCVLLQYVCLAWLFSLPQLNQVGSMDSSGVVGAGQRAAGVDYSGTIVSIRLVYDCSHMLKSVKSVLLEHVMGVKSKVNVSRKITPLTATSVNSERASVTSSSLTIQQYLEDNFFHNQPSSLKKSVSFLAERVSSSYIKEFRASTLADNLTQSKLWVHTQAKKVQVLADVKSTLAPILQAKCSELNQQLHSEVMSGVRPYLERRVASILQLLLPSDIEKCVADVCATVTLRQGVDKVNKWLKTNLTVQYLVTELTQEMAKFCRTGGNCPAPDHQLTDSFVKLGRKHDVNAPSPCKTLHELQLFTGELSTHPSANAARLEAVLRRTLSCVRGRNDIECIAMNSICFLVVTLLVTVARCHVQSISWPVLDICLQLCTIEGLETHWSRLEALVPDIDGVQASDGLYEKWYDYVLYMQGLLSVGHGV